jgi:hypothetical protein
MLDAIENRAECPVSRLEGRFNEINDLAGIGGNEMVRRSTSVSSPRWNRFWG